MNLHYRAKRPILHTVSGRVYYDDTCTLCERGAAHLRSETEIETVGISSSDIPTEIDKRKLQYEIHAVDDDGRVYGGVDALIKILEWHPRFKWLAPFVALQGIKQCVAVGYWVIARTRHMF